jgi:hypothetical protein
VSVTKAFLKTLQRDKLVQASLVRIYATVRHFARWLHWKFPDFFPLGCPTEGVKLPAGPTADWKGFTRLDAIRLTAAAQTLRAARAWHEPGITQPCAARRVVRLWPARLGSAGAGPGPVYQQGL